jgi:hypothetical protein
VGVRKRPRVWLDSSGVAPSIPAVITYQFHNIAVYKVFRLILR